MFETGNWNGTLRLVSRYQHLIEILHADKPPTSCSKLARQAQADTVQATIADRQHQGCNGRGT